MILEQNLYNCTRIKLYEAVDPSEQLMIFQQIYFEYDKHNHKHF